MRPAEAVRSAVRLFVERPGTGCSGATRRRVRRCLQAPVFYVSEVPAELGGTPGSVSFSCPQTRSSLVNVCRQSSPVGMSFGGVTSQAGRPNQRHNEPRTWPAAHRRRVVVRPAVRVAVDPACVSVGAQCSKRPGVRRRRYVPAEVSQAACWGIRAPRRAYTPPVATAEEAAQAEPGPTSRHRVVPLPTGPRPEQSMAGSRSLPNSAGVNRGALRPICCPDAEAAPKRE